MRHTHTGQTKFCALLYVDLKDICVMWVLSLQIMIFFKEVNTKYNHCD